MKLVSTMAFVGVLIFGFFIVYQATMIIVEIAGAIQ